MGYPINDTFSVQDDGVAINIVSNDIVCNGGAICEMWRRGNNDLEIHYARRIAICLNACVGIPNEVMKSWLNPPEGQLGAPHGTWSTQLASAGRRLIQLQQERDELLSSCKPLLQILRNWEPDHSSGEDRQRIVRAIEAIAKIEGIS